MQNTTSSRAPTTECVSFGGGCFWCIEAVFQQVDGVLRVTSGYQGGHTADPDYREVCSGATGHAEVVQVEFDPAKAPFKDLLELFWQAHDPTTPNRQGPDSGTQYRSVVYTHTDAQLAEAMASRDALNASGRLNAPVITEIAPAPPYPAEDYHQDYFHNHPHAPYCAIHIAPKLRKLGMA
jgi:peptide-methionine (S)-S-oxide reductase